MASGDTVDISPKSWSIVDGKLYLNYNNRISRKWNKDKEALIKKADLVWPTLLARE